MTPEPEPTPEPVSIQLRFQNSSSGRYDIDFLKNGVRFDGLNNTGYVTSDPVDALPSDVFTIVGRSDSEDITSPPLTSVSRAGVYLCQWSKTNQTWNDWSWQG